MGYESVVKKHLYEKNSHLELFMNGNEITVLDKFTNKERIKLKISGNNVQFFDGIMNHHFGEEKPPKYLCEPSFNSPSGDGMIDYLLFDCTDLENIKKLEGKEKDDFQEFKKIKFKDNNVISMISYGDDHIGIGGHGVYLYKIKKDVYQRDGHKLVKIRTKQYEIESNEVRQKRYEINEELIRTGVIPMPY